MNYNDFTQNGVYKITNLVNGKIYIGSSADKGGFKERWRKRYNKYFTNAINKYGSNNFKYEILEICEPKYCLAYEQIYLDYYKPFISRGNGYNIYKIAGSPLGVKRSIETRLKYSIAKRLPRRPFSEEHRKNISIGQKGSIRGPLSREHKEKLRKSNRGQKRSPQFCAQNGKWQIRAVERIDIFTGEIKEYDSMILVNLDGFDNSTVSKCCRGLRSSHKKYYWNFIE